MINEKSKGRLGPVLFEQTNKCLAAGLYDGSDEYVRPNNFTIVEATDENLVEIKVKIIIHKKPDPIDRSLLKEVDKMDEPTPEELNQMRIDQIKVRISELENQLQNLSL